MNGLNNFTIEIDKTANQIPSKECPGFACQVFQTKTYCAVNATDPDTMLDPRKNCTEAERRAPFSVCKNNCPGVGVLGVIGGGALAFTATAFGGIGLLPALGLVPF